MTQEEIKEANELIAVFMGLTRNDYDCGKTWGLNSYTDENGILFAEWWNPLQYHSDWSWIMPVIEKIELLGYACLMAVYSNHFGEGKHVFSFKIRFFDKLGVYFHESFGFKSKIEAVFKAVVEFIKWYNQNKDQHGN